MSNPWEGILDEGEAVIWHGRPAQGFAMAQEDMLPLVFGLVFSAFAMIWIGIAAIGAGLFWMLGLIHFGAGAGLAVYAFLRDTVARRYSYYTLTNSRAIIGTSYPWADRQMLKKRITPRTKIKLHDGHTLVFGKPGRSKRHPFPLRSPQFTRIDDAEHVLDLMRQIQKDKS